MGNKLFTRFRLRCWNIDNFIPFSLPSCVSLIGKAACALDSLLQESHLSPNDQLHRCTSEPLADLPTLYHSYSSRVILSPYTKTIASIRTNQPKLFFFTHNKGEYYSELIFNRPVIILPDRERKVKNVTLRVTRPSLPSKQQAGYFASSMCQIFITRLQLSVADRGRIL